MADGPPLPRSCMADCHIEGIRAAGRMVVHDPACPNAGEAFLVRPRGADDIPDMPHRYVDYIEGPVGSGWQAPVTAHVEPAPAAPSPAPRWQPPTEAVAVADVEADLAADDAPAREEGMCPAELALIVGGEYLGALRCWDKAGHLMPHVDKAVGCRWDTSALSLPWPANAAAAIVREVLAAARACIEGDSQSSRGAALGRWEAAIDAAELLPGVKPPEGEAGDGS